MALKFLWPDGRRLLLFLGFAFLCIAGATQTYAFIDDVPGLEKPVLFDGLRPFDFWSAWIFFSAPLHISAYLLCSLVDVCSAIFFSFPSMGAVKFPVTGVIYSYLAASWLVWSWDRWWPTAGRLGRLSMFMIPLAAAAGTRGPALPFISVAPQIASFAVSGFILTYAVLAFYSIAIYGVTRMVRASITRATTFRNLSRKGSASRP